MDRFDAMRLYTRIVDLGSFTRAADDLQLPRATVTLAIQQLEKRLGTRLLQRTTRHVSPTPDGTAYYARCQRLLADLEETESAFSTTTAPRGLLRVDLQGTLARRFVLPRLDEFCTRYPAVELEIGMGDRLVDLVREGMDCVLRSGELSDSSMVARRVALLPQLTCASPAYLAMHGVPDSIEALQRGHRAVNFLSTRSGKRLPLDFMVDGVARTLQLKGTVTVNDADAYTACCEAGLGLVQVPRYRVAQQLAAGTLVELLPQWRPAPMPVSVLYPQHRQLSPRVRVFVDWLAQVMEPVSLL